MMLVTQFYDVAEMAEIILGEADMSEEGMDGHSGNMDAE